MKKWMGVDIDQVVGDSDIIIRDICKTKFGIIAERKDIKQFSIAKSLGITNDMETELFRIFHSERLLDIPEIKGASYYLRKIRKLGWGIRLITARPIFTYDLTALWLNQISIPYEELIFEKNKQKHFEEIDILAEDNGQTAYSFASTGKRTFLFDCPWNQDIYHKNIERVNFWKTVYYRMVQIIN